MARMVDMDDGTDASNGLSMVRISCQDLDKTTYVPGNEETNHKNLQAMVAFEALERGGTHLAVFVTGNNVAMAQVKATEMMAGDLSLSSRFADLTRQPGVYSNGALVKGLAGEKLEDFCRALPASFVASLVDAIVECPQRPCPSLPDDAGCVFYSETEMIMLDHPAVRARLEVSDLSMRRVRGFCEEQMHMPVVLMSAPAIKELAGHGAIYQVTLLYAWIGGLKGEALKEEYVAVHGAATEARKAELAALLGGGDVGALLEFKALPAPWPSMDINAKGVNKRNAIVALCAHLSDATCEQYTLDEVAVFGDAGNDLPMFEAVDATAPVPGYEGQRARVRVAMPGSRCTEPRLAEASNLRCDVYEALDLAVRLQETG